MKIFNKTWLTAILFVMLISGLSLTGCSQSKVSSADDGITTDKTAETQLSEEPNQKNIANQPNTMKDYLPRLEGKATVELVVNNGKIVIEVNGDDAPITAGNFVDLVQRGVYDGLVFHRVVKQPQPFVAQGGDPQGNGTGGFIEPETKKRRYIPLEIKLAGESEPTYSKALGRQGGGSPDVVLKHRRGAIAMARSNAPDSASSQFYFALSDLDFLDGDYAVFGYVTEGMDIVDSIEQGDIITSAKVVSGLENLKK